MYRKPQQINTAVNLLFYLGAYSVNNLVANVSQWQKDAAKRRTRPMKGRGNFGATLKAHFDSAIVRVKKHIKDRF